MTNIMAFYLGVPGIYRQMLVGPPPCFSVSKKENKKNLKKEKSVGVR